MSSLPPFFHFAAVWGSRCDGWWFLKSDPEICNDEASLEPIQLKHLGDGHFKVCCLPFLIHGLHLGDSIIVYDDKSFDVVRRSSYYTYQVFSREPEFVKQVILMAQQRGGMFEQYSPGLASVCVKGRSVAQSLWNEYLAIQVPGKSEVGFLPNDPKWGA